MPAKSKEKTIVQCATCGKKKEIFPYEKAIKKQFYCDSVCKHAYYDTRFTEVQADIVAALGTDDIWKTIKYMSDKVGKSMTTVRLSLDKACDLGVADWKYINGAHKAYRIVKK